MSEITAEHVSKLKQLFPSPEELTTELGPQILKLLERINEVVPIEPSLFVIYLDLWREFENNGNVARYLASRKEISIEQIKNTKALFQKILYRYFDIISKADHNMADMSDYDKAIGEVDKIAVIMSIVADYEELVLKTPTAKSIREESAKLAQ